MSLFKKKKEPTEVEVSEKNVGLRITFAAVFLVIGLIALGFFLIQLLGEDAGWQTIELSDKSFVTADEIVLNYDLGQGELSATAEKRELQKAYTAALSRVYKLFDARVAYEGLVNVNHINRHPGKILTVDPDLYAAFALLESYGDRSVYLAPIQAQYRNLFSCTDDITAASLDPRKNEEAKALVSELAAFASDPAAIRIELLGSNQLRLTVSETYLAYAKEHEIETVVDFSRLMNAFVVDAVADELMAKGYTRGYLSSYDGYTRYLDAESNSYTVHVYDRVDKTVYPAAQLECVNVGALVQMRDYPLRNYDAGDYYGYADGSYASRYLGMDGLYRTALHDLTAYSADKGCAELALTLSAVFIAEETDEAKLTEAASRGIFAVWCADRVVRFTDGSMTPKKLYSDDTVQYVSQAHP